MWISYTLNRQSLLWFCKFHLLTIFNLVVRGLTKQASTSCPPLPPTCPSTHTISPSHIGHVMCRHTGILSWILQTIRTWCNWSRIVVCRRHWRILARSDTIGLLSASVTGLAVSSDLFCFLMHFVYAFVITSPALPLKVVKHNVAKSIFPRFTFPA